MTSPHSALSATKTRRVQVLPENNQSFTTTALSGADVFFSLPAGSKYTMINGQNSYISFNFKVASLTGGASTGINNGDGGSLIRTMEVVNQSQSIELVDRYNVFSNIVADFTPSGRALTMNTILQSGTTSVKTGVALAASAYSSCCLPIYSAIYGCLAGNYAPATDGIRIRFSFESPDIALTGAASTTASTYTIENLCLFMEYVDVEPAIHDELVRQSGGVFKTHGTALANYQTTSVASTQQNILIPARFSSVKHIWSCARLTSNIGTPLLCNSTGSRYFPNVASLYYTIAGRQYPQIPIRCVAADNSTYYGAEVMTEFIKTLHALHTAQADCVFTLTNYLSTSSTTAGGFVWGYDFETDGGSSLQIGGIDTNSSNVFLTINSVSAPTASTIDSFVFYDLILETNVMDGSVSISK